MDIRSREALESMLESYAGAILTVTHDRYFVQRFADRAMVIEGGGLHWFTP